MKLKGDLDYKLVRGPLTPLDDMELAYCVNDVLIVTEYIREKIELHGTVCRILVDAHCRKCVFKR